MSNQFPSGPGSGFPQAPAGIYCPKCNSKNLQATVETDTKVSGGQGFSGGKGCLGFLMFGPLGLLCGSCGNKKATATTTNKNFYVCMDCGNKFRNPVEAIEEATNAQRTGHAMGVFMVVLAVLCFIVLIALSAGIGWSLASVIFLILGLICAVLAPILLVAAKKAKAELDTLQALYPHIVSGH